MFQPDALKLQREFERTYLAQSLEVRPVKMTLPPRLTAEKNDPRLCDIIEFHLVNQRISRQCRLRPATVSRHVRTSFVDQFIGPELSDDLKDLPAFRRALR